MSFAIKHGVLIFFLCVLVQVVVLEEAKNANTDPEPAVKFYLSLDKANYFDAFVHCQQGGMELASIEDEEESAVLDSFLDPYKIEGFANGFWLSGTNFIDTSSFQYYWLSTGARTIFTNWFLDEPDNYADQEHCMQWAYYNGTPSDNKTIGWNDYPCEAPIRYVCENTTIRFDIEQNKLLL